jgi:hypothetical protein
MGVIFRALEIGGFSSFPKFNDHQKDNIFVHRYKNMKDIVMISGKRQNHCSSLMATGTLHQGEKCKEMQRKRTNRTRTPPSYAKGRVRCHLKFSQTPNQRHRRFRL